MSPRSSYVDPVAVERAAMGDKVRLSPAERRAAVQRLTRRGLSATAIADRLRVSSRTVTRCRGRQLVEVSDFGS